MQASGDTSIQNPHLVLEPVTDVMRRVRMCKSKLYQEVAKGTFPRPVKIGRGTAFVSSEVDAWIAKRIAERDETALQCSSLGQPASRAARRSRERKARGSF